MDGIITIGTKIDTKSFDAQIEQMNDKITELEFELEKFEPNTKEYQEINVELEKAKNKLGDLIRKQEELSRKKGIKSMIDGIGDSMDNIIKKVTRWGLAIFGIRSVYNFIRQSISTLSQYDDQLATNFKYIRWALAMSIKPIIDWIIKAVYQLIGFIGGLINSIFNVNIFANASADAFKRTKDNLNGANKEAKKLQKTLAGFDEMNILQDNGSVTPGGGGGGIPTIDLGDIADNSTIKKLKNFWSDIFKFWEEDWKHVFNDLDGKWGAFISGLILTVKGFWDILKGLGEIIIGLVEMIVGIVTGNFDLVKQGFNVMIEGIKDILTGAIEIITGVLLTVFGFVKGIFLEIWKFFYKILIKPIMDVLNKASSWVNEKASGVVNGIKNTFKGISNWIENNVTKPIGKFFSDLWDGIKNGASAISQPIKNVFDGMISAITSSLNIMIDGINLLIRARNKLNPFSHIPEIPKIGTKKTTRSSGGGGFRAKGGIFYPSKLPKLASGGIINMPGSGIPYHGAYIGERGAEAVVPLTDSQQMALLGETIGRYITVNAQMNNYMNGRLISRELQKVQNDSDFAYNR